MVGRKSRNTGFPREKAKAGSILRVPKKTFIENRSSGIH